MMHSCNRLVMHALMHSCVKECSMAKKLTGKYVEGQEPWVLAGIKRPAFYDRLRKEGEADGPMHQAQRQALEIAASDAPVEADGPAASVEAPAAPAAPEPAKAKAKGEPTTPSEPMPPPPAPARVQADPVTPSETMPQQSGATVNVTFRCPPSVHDRMREMAHQKRVKLQGIVAAAVEAYLTANKF